MEKPIINELEILAELPKHEQTGQFKIQLEKQDAKDLKAWSLRDNFNEVAVMRVFYWAAFYGKQNFVIGYMILLLKWSPFIKSYQRQSVLTAAIRGKQTELIRKMANFRFLSAPGKNNSVNVLEDWVVENWYGKDEQDNIPLHYAY